MGRMHSVRGFTPDWSTHPGEHLQEYLEAFGWNQAQFARIAGLTPKLVSEIIHAKNPITTETALKLEKVFGLKADIWLNLQSSWDLHQARQNADKRLSGTINWLDLFPLPELKNRGWLPKTNDKRIVEEALLKFLRIGDPSGFDERFASLCVQHRQSSSFRTSKHHIACWLMLGEHQAREMNLPPFDKDRFLKAVNKIRTLTYELPEIFESRMKALCFDAGAALVFERPIKKTAIFGSTHWLDKRNPVIQMSLRGKSNDHFWWTFFHEAGHVHLHRGKTFLDENKKTQDKLEQEADEWAIDRLVGLNRFNQWRTLSPRSKEHVQSLADSIDLHPGILIGMLQHDGIIPFSHLNSMKVKFEWKN